MGIEPTSEAWEASILPLYDARSSVLSNYTFSSDGTQQRPHSSTGRPSKTTWSFRPLPRQIPCSIAAQVAFQCSHEHSALKLRLACRLVQNGDGALEHNFGAWTKVG